ncbi:SICAvar, type I [Plasmodium knowlesi strain H]|uniref:SICAvar, type I n=1 Tax=Plasmodium knowlesi (strain H) TaxID=5851 RepID=A0A1A7VRU3_PLAKH|nr:SICAvar, type I [Plasmodium knowlesi strain H]
MADKFAGVLTKWYQDQGASGGPSGQDGGYAELEKLMKEMLAELGRDMDDSTPDHEVASACANAGEKYPGQGMTQDKEICKALVKALYWMNGRSRGSAGTKGDDGAGGQGLKDLKQYLRCIVGYSAMIKLLSNKCEVQKIMVAVENAEASVAGGGNELLSEKCKDIKYEDIALSAQILGEPLAEWVRNLNRAGSMMSLYINWRLCPSNMKWEHGQMKEGEDENKEILQLLKEKKARELHKKVYPPGSSASASGSSTSQDNILKKVLEDAASCSSGSVPGNGDMKKCLKEKLELEVGIGWWEPHGRNCMVGTGWWELDSGDWMVETGWWRLDGMNRDAEVCMKNSSNDFCRRLQCAEQYWELNKNDKQNSQNFWDDYVKPELGKVLPTAAHSNDGSTPDHCDSAKGLDNANKEACTHMTKLLNAMYQNSNSDPNKYSDQIINCLLLNAYAIKLKDEAKKKGYCDIDKGLQEAFTNAGKGNSSNNDVPCQWNEKILDTCQSATTPNDKLKDKVESMLNTNDQGNDDGIQETLIAFNKNSELCERVKCALNWYKNNNVNGHGAPEWEEVWNKVKEDVTSLGQSMSNTDNSLNSHCNDLDNKNKEMCLLFAKGLNHMYKETDAKDDPMKLFRRTMMCAALNAYAKELKEDANKKDKCDIGEGITRAFNKSNDIMEKAAATCKDPKGANCFVCKEENFDNCQITTSGNTGGTEDTMFEDEQDKTGLKESLDKICENVNSKLQTMFEDEQDKTGLKESLDKICENVNSKLQTMFEDEQNKTGLKESLDKICLPCLDSENLCERAGCVAKRWVENGNAQNGDNLWKTGNGVGKELKELSEKMKGNKGEAEKHCKDLKEEEKVVCELIASGLKSIYEIEADKNSGGKITKKALEDQLFKRTMRCVLLNAFADKLEQLPCSQEKKVKDAIDEAFKKSDEIKDQTSPCNNDGDKCFKCGRESIMTCQINSEDVKTKLDPSFTSDEGIKKTLKESEDKICKPCKEDNLCERLQCVANKWKKNKGENGTVTWDEMKDDFGAELKALLDEMKKNENQDAVAKEYCTADKDGNTWSESDAHGVANKTACKLVARGLQHISSIQKKYEGEEKNPYDNQEFKQIASCLMLKAVVRKMKEQSPICYIEPGIKKAFESADKIKQEKCKNKTPCIVCNWTDDDYNQFGSCKVGTEEIKPKLDKLLKDNDSIVNTALMDITTTAGNNNSNLCFRLQCLASRVKASTNGNFWTTNGEVGQLWTQLSTEMKTNKNDEAKCKTMDNGTTGATVNGRPATDPEKKACQYLTAGFNKLKTISTTPTNGGNNILDKHPSLKQTVGCLLLHAYAKQMKEKSKCVIDSGIVKAFKVWNESTNGTCNGKGQCVPCPWKESDYDNCSITTNATTKEKTPAKTKVEGIVTAESVPKAMEDINKMQNLCDYIKCAAPNWFKSKLPTTTNGGVNTGTPGTATTTWCDFWDTTVKGALRTMFEHIEKEGKNNKDGVCTTFGDENPQSVERKACNHITAGLQHIKDVKGDANGSTQPNAEDDDKFLKQTMMCAALNLYADEIKKQTDNICPIGEDKISAMFTTWNEKNKSSPSPSSSCNGGGSNNVCFKCIREPDFSGCNLLVDSNLVEKANGNCTDKDNRDNVQTQINKLLNEDSNQSQSNSINNTMQKTFSEITKMDHNFCTQVQCAIKKKLKIKNGQATSTGTTQSWSDIDEDAKGVLMTLLEQMTEGQTKPEVTTYCNNSKWDNGYKEDKTNKAACLLFAAGLQHIYKNKTKDQFNGPSFGQTMGCLFLKEYAKQLKDLAKIKKTYEVHPKCSVDEGIDHAFGKSAEIMRSVLTQCNGNSNNSCFECKLNGGYETCKMGQDNIGNKSKELFTEPTNKKHMEQTLANTLCPILPMDFLAPFVPLAPVSIGLSAMAYYLWKYFGPLGKGGQRFRRSPAEIPGPSVQEQVLDHVDEGASHEYRLVKERKPRSAPTRTKRSGHVNRRTIIEIHFEVLDECQKGDTQLNQKDFLELLVQEFMGSELMEEEEQVPKELVPMEAVPMELVSIEEVPSLGSRLMV